MTDPAEQQDAQRPFIEPGYYYDLSNDDYHGSFGFSSSQVKTLVEKTPAHLKHSFTAERSETENMLLGTVVHTLVLEPEKFDDEFYVSGEEKHKMPRGRGGDIVLSVIENGSSAWESFVIEPAMNKRTKAGKEEFAAFQAKCEREALTVVKQEHIDAAAQYMDAVNQIGDRIPITKTMHDKAQAMAASVKAHPDASAMLLDVIPESSVYWWYNSTDPDDDLEYKLMCKVRPDALSRRYPVVIDVKTTVDASLSGFQRSIQKFQYHLSAAMYLEGVNQCKPLLKDIGFFAYTKFVFICVENFEPYLTAVYEMSPEYLDLGKQLYRLSIRKLQQGMREDWPGYPDEIRLIDPPPWGNRLHTV